MYKNELPKIKYQKLKSQNKWQKVNVKQVQSNHGPPVLTLKLLGKTKQQNKKHKTCQLCT